MTDARPVPVPAGDLGRLLLWAAERWPADGEAYLAAALPLLPQLHRPDLDGLLSAVNDNRRRSRFDDCAWERLRLAVLAEYERRQKEGEPGG